MLHTVGVETFGYVVIVVASLGVIAAVVSLRGTSGLYDGIGKGAFSLDEPDRPRGPALGSPRAMAEAQAEIRQFVEAKSARREARGEAPLDVEAEIAASSPSRRRPSTRSCATRSASSWSPATTAGWRVASRPSTWRPRSTGRSATWAEVGFSGMNTQWPRQETGVSSSTS